MVKHLQGTAANERAELYFQAYPGSPSAVRRPRLLQRSGTWIALLGNNLARGIAGFGPSVEGALRAFDRQYLSALRLPEHFALGEPTVGSNGGPRRNSIEGI